jgi:thymidylate synthase (FAD)
VNREELIAKYGDGTTIPVLDHGHVTLVDVMGGDERVEQVARLSYQKGTRKVSETRGLLRYLLRHKHTSPFEQAVITLDIKLPIFVARQLVRHRTQSLNELSGRYSELPEEFYVPLRENICYQSTDNKQGRSGPLPEEEAWQLQKQLHEEAEESFASYHQFLEAGVSRETARINLPLSTYTQWCTTMNLHNLLHMLALRLDPHAQWECHMYAEAIARIVRDWVPITWEAFEDFVLEAETFSKQELLVVRTILGSEHLRNAVLLTAEGPNWSEREKKEFLKKLGILE